MSNITTKTNAEIGFSNVDSFALLQRTAKMFNSSSLVPPHFQGEQNFGNCVIALEMAHRMGATPLMVMQNLYVVYGTPSWSAKFLISMFNMCGRFSAIKYKETGKKGTDSQGIVAYATELSTGQILEGPEITIKLAKDEGWYDKKGSKWLTMADQMLRYRAASWFIKTTAPELSMGLYTRDEVMDVGPENLDDRSDVIDVKATIADNANTKPLDFETVEKTETGDFFDKETGEVIDMFATSK